MKKEFFNMVFISRPYISGDETQIVEQLKTVFKKWPKFDIKCSSLDHWKWKFLDNPSKQVLVTVTLDKDRIIGSSHVVRKLVKIGDNILSSGIAADGVVNQEYRGQGVFKENYLAHVKRAGKDGIRCWSGTSSNPVMINMMEKTAYPFPHKLVELIRVRDLVKHMQNSRNWRRMIEDVKQNLSNKLKDIAEPNIKEKNLIKNIKTITKFDDRVDAFWAKIKDDYNFIYVRNKEYLNWRYCNARGGEFVTKVVQDCEEILGYIVLRVNKANKKYFEGYIVDLVILPDRNDVLESLVINALTYFDELNVNVVQYWGLDLHPYSELLKMYGFVEVPYRLALMFNNRLITKEELDIIAKSKIEQLHYSFGDHDMI